MEIEEILNMRAYRKSSRMLVLRRVLSMVL
jgi:hypothetical protein